MKLIFFVVVISLFSLLVNAQPTGFPKPIVWLKASDFIEKSNQWEDASGNKNHATTASQAFTLNVNLLNFNPSVNFSTQIDYFDVPLDRSKHSTQLSFVTVYLSKGQTPEKSIWAITRGYNSDLSTKYVAGPTQKAEYIGGNLNSPVISTVRQNWGKPDANTDKGSVQLGGIIKGQSNAQEFTGNIAEFLIFDKTLENEDFQMLSTYLSLKYGTTFHIDYLNSKGDVLLTQAPEQGLHYRVFGIGRDDGFGLYQKQATNRNEAGLQTISAGSLKASNKENTFELQKGEFLLFSDNGGNVENELVPDEGFHSKLPLMDRQYQVKRIGDAITNVPTELRFFVDTLLNDPPLCYLLFNKNGSDDFSSDETEYILPSAITEEGEVIFNNMKWDTDDSGTDSYALTLGFFKNEEIVSGDEDNTIYFTNNDIKHKFKSTRGNFLLNATITSLPEHGVLKLNGKKVEIGDEVPMEGELNYSFEPESNWYGDAVFNWTGAVDYGISGIEGLSVTAIEGKVIILVKPVNDFPLIDDFIKGCDNEKILAFEDTDFKEVFSDVDGDHLSWVQITETPEHGLLKLGYATLQAGDKIASEQLSGITYVPNDESLLYDSFMWNASDGVAYADNAKRAGLVMATKDKLQSNGGGISALVYPNPASDIFRLTVLLENESNISIDIYNAVGQPVLIKNTGQAPSTLFNYEFSGFQNGVYYIKVKTPTESQSLKLIISK